MFFKKNKLITAVSVFLFFLLTSFSAEAGSIKIATINMQKVVRESALGKKVMEELNQKFEALKQKLKARQDEINSFKTNLAKKAPLMSEDARVEKERELQKMLRDFKEKSDDAQFEMRQAESKHMEPILKKLEKVVTKFGKDGKYTMILEENMPGIYYFDSSVDVTAKVTKAFDKHK